MCVVCCSSVFGVCCLLVVWLIAVSCSVFDVFLFQLCRCCCLLFGCLVFNGCCLFDACCALFVVCWFGNC